MREELARVAPRLIRHARLDESYANGARQEFARSVEIAKNTSDDLLASPAASQPFLDVFLPSGVNEHDLVQAVQFHRGRYDFIGSPLQRTSVRFGWQAIPLAEIRDLNRHRTGSKYFTLSPVGTYLADDEVERIEAAHPTLSDLCQSLRALRPAGIAANQLTRQRLAAGDPAFVYWMPMGSQCFYEHTTTANHFLYQAELRTGLGSHYVYAARMREVLDQWHAQFPGTAQYIQAGTAEPE